MSAKFIITQPTPHDSLGALVFWCQRSLKNCVAVIQMCVAYVLAVFESRTLF